MTTQEALQEFDTKDFALDSVEFALDTVSGAISWMEHISEGEFSQRDRLDIVMACRKFYGVIRPMTAKYIDGD